LVKEVDALGGAMAAATDESGIQFRILNSSKGAAVARHARASGSRSVQTGDTDALGKPAQPVVISTSSRRFADRARQGIGAC